MPDETEWKKCAKRAEIGNGDEAQSCRTSRTFPSFFAAFVQLAAQTSSFWWHPSVKNDGTNSGNSKEVDKAHHRRMKRALFRKKKSFILMLPSEKDR